MAVDRIRINEAGNSNMADRVNNAIDLIVRAKAELQQAKDVADQCVDGASYTDVEAQFGVPTNQGQTFYNLLAGAVADLDVTNITEFTSRIGRL